MEHHMVVGLNYCSKMVENYSDPYFKLSHHVIVTRSNAMYGQSPYRMTKTWY